MICNQCRAAIVAYEHPGATKIGLGKKCGRSIKRGGFNGLNGTRHRGLFAFQISRRTRMLSHRELHRIAFQLCRYHHNIHTSGNSDTRTSAALTNRCWRSTDASSLLSANDIARVRAPGGPGESHPRAPAERSVTVSRHSASMTLTPARRGREPSPPRRLAAGAPF